MTVELTKKTVGDYMSKTVFTVKLDATVAQVIDILDKKNVSGAPVVSGDGSLIGIVSILDMIVAASLGLMNSKLSQLPAQLTATKPVITLKAKAPIKDGIVNIAKKRIGRVIIVDDHNKPIGMLSRRDLLRFYAQQM